MPQVVWRPSAGPRIRTLNEVIAPIVPMGTTTTRLFRQDLVHVSSCHCERRRSAPAELGVVVPHTMQDDGRLARYGVTGQRPLGAFQKEK